MFYTTWSRQRIAPKWILFGCSQADHWRRQGIKTVQGLNPEAPPRRPATSQKSLLSMLHVDTCSRTSNFETTGGENQIYPILKVWPTVDDAVLCRMLLRDPGI